MAAAAAAWPGMLKHLVPLSLRAAQAHTSDTLWELAEQVWAQLDASGGQCVGCGRLHSRAMTPLICSSCSHAELGSGTLHSIYSHKMAQGTVACRPKST